MRLDGSGVAWQPLWVALALGLLGAGVAHATYAARTHVARRRAPALAARVAGLLLVVLAPVAARAQSLDSIPLGTRVRADVHTAHVSRIRRVFAQPVAGELVGVRGDTLLLSVRAGADPLLIPRSALRDLHVSRGRPGRLSSALRSAVVPTLLSGAFGGLSVAVRRREGDPSIGRAALASAASTAAISAAMGAAFPKERWRRVAPRTTNDRLASR